MRTLAAASEQHFSERKGSVFLCAPLCSLWLICFPTTGATEEHRGQPAARKVRYRAMFAALAATSLFLNACSGAPSEKETAVPVQIVTVQKTTLQHTVEAEGVLYPLEQSALTPKISAPVKAFYVKRGSRVHRGQFLLDPDSGLARRLPGVHHPSFSLSGDQLPAHPPSRRQRRDAHRPDDGDHHAAHRRSGEQRPGAAIGALVGLRFARNLGVVVLDDIPLPPAPVEIIAVGVSGFAKREA
jgi:hypothetical protein